MFMNSHIHGFHLHHFHGFSESKKTILDHKVMLTISLIILATCLIFVALIWLNKALRIQYYDPLQIEERFYPYILT